MIIMKIIVTGWSITTGYRGGLVFPSIFFGVALSLIFEKIHPVFAGSGIMIGTSTGIMVTLLSPILGFVMMVSLIPLELISIVIAGLVGSLIAINFIKKFHHITSK
jgi:H+/Cl- antiporter ClcA